jgi:Ca2+-binding RTX toxin-like protein
MANVIKGDNNDNVLIGTAGIFIEDEIYGYGGNDYLYGNIGWDLLYGGEGDDKLRGGAGADWLDGGNGVDTADYLDSATGVLVNLMTGSGSFGTATGDALISIENINGSGYEDTLVGNDVANVLIGFDGNDYLSGNGGNDQLYGLQGDDTLIGGTGADILDGGIGSDTANYATSASRVWVDLTTGQGYLGDAAGDQLYGIENVYGSGFNDMLVGDANANKLSGDNGNDYLAGGLGGDSLDGGSGVDTASYTSSSAGVSVDLASGRGYYGEAEGDRLYNIENLTGSTSGDTLIGNEGANVLTGLGGDDYLTGGAGADILDGGSDIDTVSYTGSSAGVWVDLANSYGSGGDAEGDIFYNIENITGSNYDDTLVGDTYDNVLNGWDGHDELRGGAGNDSLKGGFGDDYLEGGQGADKLVGGEGVDTASYHYSSTGVAVDLATGTGSNGEAAGDVLYGVENVTGSNFDDTLIGDAKDNVLGGLRGQDTLKGGLGADDLYAGGTHAGYTDDVRDTFVYASIGDSGTTATTWDQIFQFDRAQSATDTTSDKIDLRLLDADPDSGDQAFRFVTEFTSPKGKQADGQVRIVDTGSDVNVEIDLNGDNTADSIIQVMNVDTLTINDFWL